MNQYVDQRDTEFFFAARGWPGSRDAGLQRKLKFQITGSIDIAVTSLSCGREAQVLLLFHDSPGLTSPS